VDAAWIQKIENELSDLRTRLAVAERDISTIMSKLDKIDSNTTWIVRLMIGGILMAIIGFMIQGGMKG
jgi:hypothetical protein